MHTTSIKTKDGQTLIGVIKKFRPVEGFFTIVLFEEKFNEITVSLDTIISAITETERGGPCDEFQRARDYMQDARRYHWEGVDELTPLREWEISADFMIYTPSRKEESVQCLCKRILEQWDVGGSQAMNQVFAHGEWAGLSVRELVEIAKNAIGKA